MFTIYYMKPEFFHYGIIGHDYLKGLGRLPDPKNIEATHTKLTEIDVPGLAAVFWKMQAENWSPNGEARELIMEKGLSHTSMSVGDIAQDDTDVYWLVDRIGWKRL